MEFEMRKIMPEQEGALIDLFVESFREDHYYRSLFPWNTAGKIRTHFSPVLLYLVEHGSALGAFVGEELAGFLLCFDYHRLKSEDGGMLRRIFGVTQPLGSIPYEEQIHKRVEALDERVIYLLSVAVAEKWRRQGIARAMMGRMLEAFEGYSFASDVSSSYSLELCKSFGFEVFPVEPGYWYVQRKAMRTTPEMDEQIPVAFPSLALFQQVFGRDFQTRPIELDGFSIEIGLHTEYFKKTRGEHCTGWVAQLTYHELLEYQRYINLAQQEESWVPSESWGPVLVYHLIYDYDGPLLWNDTLQDMLQTRQKEWDAIGDTYTLFPVEYTKPEIFGEVQAKFDPQMKTFLRYLDFRTHYETGVPMTGDQVDEMSDFKKRIKRRHLGKLKVKITQEISPDCYLSEGATEGQPAYVDLLLSLDTKSRCGVLSLVSLSLPFLISHYMDNIIRNQLLVQDEQGDWVNFYEYIYAAFGLLKRGTPKIFTVIPQEKDCLSEQQIASLLMAETIYESGEELGGFCDEDVLAPVRSEYGMGQYSRAFVCANSNVLLQFGACSRGLVTQRLEEEAITYFYIELTLFEEAAIQIADSAIVTFLTKGRKRSMTRFLKRTYQIYEDYSDTIAFWDVQVNYPSSRKSIAMIRKAFLIEEQLGYLERDKGQLQSMFDTKRDIMDRTEAVILNYIMLFLALMQGIDMVAPDLFARWDGLPLGGGILLLMMLVYTGFKRLAARSRRRK